MAKLSSVYRSRARRVAAIPRTMLGAEASIALKGVREGVAEALERSPLPQTGRMLHSVQVQFLGPTYLIGYNTNIARHAPIRANMKGVSKLGGHVLDMNPAAYMREKYGPAILGVRRHYMSRALGPGARSVNGR